MSKTNLLPHRILVGLSCSATLPGPNVAISQADLHAFDQALWLAERIGAELRLFHVVDWLDVGLAKDDDFVEREIQGGLADQLAELRERAAQRGSRGIRTSVGFAGGRAWYELLREAHRWQADLIVISPRRSDITWTDRVVRGSTANRVLRKAACPVWVVEPSTRVGIEGILAAVDLTAAGTRVVRDASALAAAVGAETHLLHSLDYPDDVALQRLPNARRAIQRHHRQVHQSAEEQLHALANESGRRWTVHLDSDWVVRAVPKIIANHEVDLVMLGCVSHPPLPSVLLGTTAERIIDRADVSAWVVRPEGWTSPLSFDTQADD